MRIDSALQWVGSTKRQVLMYLSFYMIGLSAFLGGIEAVETGAWPLLSPSMVVVSLGITALLRFVLERSLDRSFLDPRVMSSGFVLGGGFVLPMALWFAARGRSDVIMSDGEEARMQAMSVIVGLIAMFMFRRYDGIRYVQADWQDALWSPSKVWIDFVVVPVSSAMFAWLMIPQIVLRIAEPVRAGTGSDTTIATLLIFVFIGCAAYDAVNPPDPTKQHVLWDWRTFSRKRVVTV